MPHFRVLRPFANGHPDSIVHPGDVITVTEGRGLALAENGLVEPYSVAEAAPVPANKMAPAPTNKALPVPASPEKRGPGRPPVRR